MLMATCRQVSDFGLTKFRQDVKEKAKDGLDHHGTIHWTAPEVLNDDVGLDYMLADVYSFGIILWELHTRNEPYAGMRCAAFPCCLLAGVGAHVHAGRTSGRT